MERLIHKSKRLFHATLLIIAFFLLSNVSYAQVPGYLGKRITLETNASVFPTFTNVMIYDTRSCCRALDKDGKEIPRVRMHYNQDFNILFTTGRDWDIGVRYAHNNFEVGYGRVQYPVYDTLYDWNGNAISIDEQNDDPVEVKTQERFLPINSNLFEILLRFYPSDNIAPLGINFQLGWGKYFTTFADDANLTLVRSDTTTITEYNEVVGSIANNLNNVNKWSFGINKKNILFKNIFYNLGMEVNIIRVKKFNGGRSRLDGVIFDAYGSISDYDAIVLRQVNYLAWENLFAFKFGVGIFL